VAKPNYAFEKRQRELAKKKKKEEKAARKTQPRAPGDEPGEGGDAVADADETGAAQAAPNGGAGADAPDSPDATR
jgi:hypothetical protein